MRAVDTICGLGRTCRRRAPHLCSKGERDQILAAFKAESARTGIGYQTLIDEALAQHLGTAKKPMTVEQVREIVREELAHTR
jgi:hypothetical protein